MSASTDAAISVSDHAARLRSLVLDYITSCGDRGATSDEAEQFLYLPHQTVSSRFTELHKRGQIVETGERRPTRSKRNAVVWKASA